MAHPLTYPVYFRRTGYPKKSMIGKFYDLVDAVRWARSRSWEHPYDRDDITLVVYDGAGRIYRKFCRGVEK